MQRLILTPEQARFIQHEQREAKSDPESKWEWPGTWKPIYDAPLPLVADNLPDPQRTNAALSMMERGCSDEQVAEQLMWKPRGSTLKGLRKLHNGKR